MPSLTKKRSGNLPYKMYLNEMKLNKNNKDIERSNATSFLVFSLFLFFINYLIINTERTIFLS